MPYMDTPLSKKYITFYNINTIIGSFRWCNDWKLFNFGWFSVGFCVFGCFYVWIRLTVHYCIGWFEKFQNQIGCFLFCGFVFGWGTVTFIFWILESTRKKNMSKSILSNLKNLFLKIHYYSSIHFKTTNQKKIHTVKLLIRLALQ